MPNQVPLPREQKQSFRREFVVDARRLEIRDDSDTGGVVFRGPGRIWQEDSGQIRFRLFDTDASRSGMHAAVEDLLPGSPKKRLLSVEDYLGREWKGSGLRDLSFDHTKGAVCEGQLRQLRSECGSEKEEDRVEVFFPREFSYPKNSRTETEVHRYEQGLEEPERIASGGRWDVWKMERENWWARLVPYEDFGMRFKLEAKKGHHLSEQIDARVQEALWLVLAEPVKWSVAVSDFDGERRFTVRDTSGGGTFSQVPPPLRHSFRDDSPSSAEALAELFELYLNCITRYSKPRLHPMSVLLLRVLTAGESTIGDLEQALCTGIEGLVDRGFPDEFKSPGENEIQAAEQALGRLSGTQWLPELEDDEERSHLADRIRGLVGTMKGSSSRTGILKHLPSADVLTPEQASAWDNLRHPVAHGGEITSPPQDRIETVWTLTTAFYRLIFCLVRYKGIFTDWSVTPPTDAKFSPTIDPGFCWQENAIER